MRIHLDTDFLVYALGTAIANDAVLLTRNTRDFSGIPELRVEGRGPRSR
jgi:predicted nucleic acid-binding protein